MNKIKSLRLPSFPLFAQRQGLNPGWRPPGRSWGRLPLHPSEGRKCCSYREEGKRKTDGKSSGREQVPLEQYNRSLLLRNNRALLWKSKYNQGIDNKDNREIILWTWSRGLFGESSQVQAPAPSSPLQSRDWFLSIYLLFKPCNKRLGTKMPPVCTHQPPMGRDLSPARSLCCDSLDYFICSANLLWFCAFSTTVFWGNLWCST